MGQYLVRRILVMIPTLLGVITIVFLALRLAPGNPASTMLGDFATPEAVAAITRELGLDQPLIVQYGQFLVNALRGDFGESYITGVSGMGEVLRVLPYSIELTVVATVLNFLIGIPAGVIAAIRRNSWVDRLVMAGALAFFSIPSFSLGTILLLIFAIDLGWFPVVGAPESFNPMDRLTYVALPALALGLSQGAFTARLTRSAMLDVLGADFVRTARAKGLASWSVVFRHALRNALLPIITSAGLSIGTLLGGSVVIETVFARPGVGKLLIDAINGRDYVQVQAAILVTAAIFIVINWLTDMAYALANPQIRLR